jgi:dihydroflavonol-4-reductase
VEALAAGARSGVEVVVVNPSYVLGVPVDESQAGETSTRVIGNFLAGRLPAVVDGATNIVDVEDVAAGHLLAATDGEPGERYILGGYNLAWVELIDRLAVASGLERPLIVLPREVGSLARLQGELGARWPVAPEAFALMAQNWRYSSRKAKRELGYNTRPLDATIKRTVEWYTELHRSRKLPRRGVSALSLASFGMRVADRAGLVSALRAGERYIGRRLITGT